MTVSYTHLDVYKRQVISLRPGMQMERDELCSRLVKLQYERNDMNFIRNKFRVKEMCIRDRYIIKPAKRKDGM